ncbi:uncharacterized protein ELE39_002673 [Cryptosporidium sp. chipmunk genotype I]|uniref:uncharacterized protein n=1 Tax=Cryptosporidium sp. chipmunk genotype I TaxID=1280935 RepID=UPI00351A3F8A|nr:hypothetical protein ELE39_002673 [Cryptosporidium sp. chipmunk genotype I]
MVEKICCRIISQIPLIKYSKLGIIVRIHASKYISQDDYQIDLVFDIYIDELLPSKSNIFFDISVNNNQGDLILLTSETCCVVALIPWDKNIGEFEKINKIYNSSSNFNSSSSSTSNSKPLINLNSSLNITDKGQSILKIKRPSHSYGLFEDEEEQEQKQQEQEQKQRQKQKQEQDNNTGPNHLNDNNKHYKELNDYENSNQHKVSYKFLNNNQTNKSQLTNELYLKQENNGIFVYNIPLVTGIMVFNSLNLNNKNHNNKIHHFTNNKSYIVKSLWYHLDDYIIFILIKSINNNNSNYNKISSKLIALDLISIINSKHEINSQTFYNINDNFIVNYYDTTNNIHIKDNTSIDIIHGTNINSSNNKTPLDFVFGKGPDVWNILTIYVLFHDNTISSICPIIMNRMKLPYFAYQLLYTNLLEQEFFLNSKEETINKQNFHYDEKLHNTLNILLGDLRNPTDESGNVIEEILQVNISKDHFQIISSILKPIPIQLVISWELENNEYNIKSLKFISITNYPLSVFVILGSNLEIGVFIASYLSLPNFQDTCNFNLIQNKNNSFVINTQIQQDQVEDIEDNFNFMLRCIQKSKIPLNNINSNSNNNDDEELIRIISNLKFYDGIHFSTIITNSNANNTSISGNNIVNNDSTYINTNNSDNNKPLFIIGISTENDLFVIHIDWLHYLFTLYSKIESDINYQNDENKVLPVSENLEIIRKCINSNPKLKIYDLLSFNNMDDYDTNFNNTYLTFISNYCISNANSNINKIDRNKVNIEFIYNCNSNNNRNWNNKCYILCNPDYDELPEISNTEIHDTKSVKREFNIKDLIDFDNIDNNDKSEILQVDYQVNKLNEYTQEWLFVEMKNYYNKFSVIGNEIKSIKNEKEISEYYLNILKFLNDYNSNIILRLNNSIKPIINLIENIKPRIDLLNELKEEIEYTNKEIKRKEDDIEFKIKNTLEMSNSINERILKIKNLFIQELNNHRIQYDQDVIIPELLLMLSNVQLELCSAILNSFNNSNDFIAINNGNDDDDDNNNNNSLIGKCKEYDDNDIQKINIFTNEFNNYVKYNKFVINNFQKLQNKILELNRIVCNYSKKV